MFLQLIKGVVRDLNLSFAPGIMESWLLNKSTNLINFLSRGILPLHSAFCKTPSTGILILAMSGQSYNSKGQIVFDSNRIKQDGQ